MTKKYVRVYVTPEVWKRLTLLKAVYSAKTGKPKSTSDVIEFLLNQFEGEIKNEGKMHI
ncbi:MAG: hypothetical protein ACTSV7_06780 [Candidatus Baldrarchaeia archaeon]